MMPEDCMSPCFSKGGLVRLGKSIRTVREPNRNAQNEMVVKTQLSGDPSRQDKLPNNCNQRCIQAVIIKQGNFAKPLIEREQKSWVVFDIFNRKPRDMFFAIL